VGSSVDEFVEKLVRNVGEDVLHFEALYAAKIRELEEAMEEPLYKHLEAYYFLKKPRVGGDKEGQIVTGAGNELVCDKLKDLANACIPWAAMLRRATGPPVGARRGTHREYLNRGAASLLADNSVMMAQAKKARAEAEKARDFYRGGAKAAGGTNAERVKKLKLTLPYKRCGRLGQWKDEPDCPRAPGEGGSVNHEGRSPEDIPTAVDGRTVTAETCDELWSIAADIARAKSVAGLTWNRRLSAYVNK
ncbi:unnamed protein product, partial [Prorocentrum cordatum]